MGHSSKIPAENMQWYAKSTPYNIIISGFSILIFKILNQINMSRPRIFIVSSKVYRRAYTYFTLLLIRYLIYFIAHKSNVQYDIWATLFTSIIINHIISAPNGIKQSQQINTQKSNRNNLGLSF